MYLRIHIKGYNWLASDEYESDETITIRNDSDRDITIRNLLRLFAEEYYHDYITDKFLTSINKFTLLYDTDTICNYYLNPDRPSTSHFITVVVSHTDLIENHRRSI